MLIPVSENIDALRMQIKRGTKKWDKKIKRILDGGEYCSVPTDEEFERMKLLFINENGNPFLRISQIERVFRTPRNTNAYRSKISVREYEGFQSANIQTQKMVLKTIHDADEELTALNNRLIQLYEGISLSDFSERMRESKRSKAEIRSAQKAIYDAVMDEYWKNGNNKTKAFRIISEKSETLFGRKYTPGQIRGIFDRYEEHENKREN